MDKWEGETAFVDVKPLTTKIEIGSFLDVYGTCYYKSAQMSELIKMIHDTKFGENEDDWIAVPRFYATALRKLKAGCA